MITPLLITGFAALFVLIGLSACFSACETILFSLNPIQVQRVRERDRKAGGRIATLLANPSRTLSAILIGNTLVNIGSASLGYALISRLVPPTWAELAAIPIMTIVLLLFAELTPKRLASIHAERLAPAASLGVARMQRLVAPMIHLLDTLAQHFRGPLIPERNTLNDEELMTVVDLSVEQGTVDKDEQVMVDGILRLSELQASDVMSPRVDIIGIDLRDSPAIHIKTSREARFRRLPVYNRTLDAIEGFLDVPRYLIDSDYALRRYVTPALFVPENISLDDLLITFQRERTPIACVLDEYGGTAGLITRGDILELVTGGDEPSLRPEVESIRKVGESSWIIEGKTSLEEINHELDLNLEADDADRISGWCTFHSGALLRVGEVVTAQRCRVHVLRMRKRRIDQVRLDILEPDLQAAQDEPDESYRDQEPDV